MMSQLPHFQCVFLLLAAEKKTLKTVHQGGSDYVLSSRTEKLMAAINFSDYLGIKHYKKAKKIKHFNHLGLANWPQSFAV